MLLRLILRIISKNLYGIFCYSNWEVEWKSWSFKVEHITCINHNPSLIKHVVTESCVYMCPERDKHDMDWISEALRFFMPQMQLLIYLPYRTYINFNALLLISYFRLFSCKQYLTYYISNGILLYFTPLWFLWKISFMKAVICKIYILSASLHIMGIVCEQFTYIQPFASRSNI